MPTLTTAQLSSQFETLNFKDANRTSQGLPIKPHPESQSTLNDLILKNHLENDIKFGGFRANHIVHGLCSLYGLGATSQQLQAYFDYENASKEPLPEAKVIITEQNWKEHFGDRSTYSSYLPFFKSEIARLGMLNTLKLYLPHLIAGFIGNALHPMIHIGYAIEFDLEIVTVEALAFATSHYTKLSEGIDNLPKPSTKNEMKAKTILIESLKRESILPPTYDTNSDLSQRINYIADNYIDNILLNVANWNCTSDNYQLKSKELALLCAEVFLTQKKKDKYDFFLLHGLTGNHAVRQILSILEPVDKVRLLNLNFLALHVLYFVQGAPQLNDELYIGKNYNRQQPDVSWDKVVSRTIASKESHLVKVIRNLYQLELEFNSPDIRYLTVANEVTDNTINNSYSFKGVGFKSN